MEGLYINIQPIRETGCGGMIELEMAQQRFPLKDS